jgi:hypothetical protein
VARPKSPAVIDRVVNPLKPRLRDAAEAMVGCAWARRIRSLRDYSQLLVVINEEALEKIL